MSGPSVRPIASSSARFASTAAGDSACIRAPSLRDVTPAATSASQTVRTAREGASLIVLALASILIMALGWRLVARAAIDAVIDAPTAASVDGRLEPTRTPVRAPAPESSSATELEPSIAPLGTELMDADNAALVIAPTVGVLPTTPALSSLEQQLFALVNADRVRDGLPALVYDGEVVALARTRASAQITQGRLTHDDGHGGLALRGLLARAGVPYREAGENLGMLQPVDLGVAERAERAFMQSPEHRSVILRPSFDRLAVGAATDSQGRIAFAQLFRDLGDRSPRTVQVARPS